MHLADQLPRQCDTQHFLRVLSNLWPNPVKHDSRVIPWSTCCYLDCSNLAKFAVLGWWRPVIRSDCLESDWVVWLGLKGSQYCHSPTHIAQKKGSFSLCHGLLLEQFCLAALRSGGMMSSSLCLEPRENLGMAIYFAAALSLPILGKGLPPW